MANETQQDFNEYRKMQKTSNMIVAVGLAGALTIAGLYIAGTNSLEGHHYSNSPVEILPRDSDLTKIILLDY